MPITIPARLQEKLRSDSTYEGCIHTLLNNTASLITEKADFFPEYTIHGWTHIQAVLFYADKLIPDVTMEALTGRDAAMLIAAVVLHDLGMFLNEAGVRKLLSGPRRTTKTARLDKLDWKSEWDRYIQEIRRYPEEKLLYHFGMSRAIEEPDLEKGEFSDLDLLIVGDFLRRHHHRIAHEIALGTMPGDTDIDVLQVGMDALGNKAFSQKDRKCIGILARSHGMPIRETRDYMDREVGRQYKEKLTYLMAVLRIADALDADEQRAPDTVRKLRGIRTPVSVKEWTWNQRITRTELDWDDDADYKYVECDPQTTTEFVHLENWLRWVQRELDTCWAVLSEVCDTQKYRLSIHRIESDILEEARRESYSEKFITKDARLNANPELLKLLVGPLYDDDPSCGVRELLQNAVDACNERAHLEGEGYRGQVEIRLDTNAGTLTVTDNGIGMDENVLLNYYLSAGASYRTSDQWFEQFATDRDPNIIRTGRFGVGVLATFLLGHQARVSTRHMDDDLGYTFEFGLEPKALDIKRPEAQPEIGTTITVTLKQDALKKLLEDYDKEKTWLNWYRFAEPSVRYWVDGEEYVSGKPFIPQDDREMAGWFDLPGTELEMVRWGYPEDGFFCNGFRIPDGYDSRGFNSGYHNDPFGEMINWWSADLIIPYPSISVLDKTGCLHIDLSRRVVEDAKIKQCIEYEIVRYTISLLLAADWSSEETVSELFSEGIWKYHKSFERERILICCKKGFTFLKPCFFGHGSTFPLLIFYLRDDANWSDAVHMIRNMKVEYPFIIYPQRVNKQGFDTILAHLQPNRVELYLPNHIQRMASTMWINPQFISQISKEKAFVSTEYSTFLEKREDKSCLVVTSEPGQRPEPFIWEQWDQRICSAISVRTVNCAGRSVLESPRELELRKMIQDILQANDPWIPYDMEARRKKFPKAFEELKYYIDRILADREKERGAQAAGGSE